MFWLIMASKSFMRDLFDMYLTDYRPTNNLQQFFASTANHFLAQHLAPGVH